MGTWNEFESAASQTVRDLLSDTEFADVTLASHDDQQIKAHKAILCSASPFFRRIISKNAHPNPLLFLRNISMKTLKSVLEFIYLGQAEIQQEDLAAFLADAQDLEIKGLMYGNENQKCNAKKKSKNAISNRKVSEDLHDRDIEEVVLNMKLDEDAIEHEVVNETSDDSVRVRKLTSEKDSSLIIQNESGMYPCDKCDYTTSAPLNLKRHDNAIHEGVRYPCEHCEYKATQKANLNRHMKKHSLN